MYTRGNGNIDFTYLVSEIFDKAARISAYSAKNLKDKEGKSMLDEFSLTEDDKDIFVQGLASVMPEIKDRIIKITDASSENEIFSKDSDVIKFSIMDNEAYNQNILSLVDDSFNECIIEGVLMFWFKHCGHGELMALHNQSFMENLNKLYNRMFQLRKKKTNSSLAYI